MQYGLIGDALAVDSFEDHITEDALLQIIGIHYRREIPLVEIMGVHLLSTMENTNMDDIVVINIVGFNTL